MTNISSFVFLLSFLLFSPESSASNQVVGSEFDNTTLLFTIQGSNTIGAVMAPNLVKSYFKFKGAKNIRSYKTTIENELVVEGVLPETDQVSKVLIAAHGSSTGFKALANNKAQIAASSRPIKNKEVSLLAEKADMRSIESEHIVGIDGVAVIVHPSRSITALSLEQIAGIFSGQYLDWSELGAEPGIINVYARDENSGTWDSFKSMALGADKSLVNTAHRFESNDALSDRVSADENGIGFVGLGSVRQSKLVAVSDGSAKALLPNKLTVATEDYALSRRLFMYSLGASDNHFVNEFLEFSLSNTGQKDVSDAGFISQELHAVIPTYYEGLPQSFLEVTAQAQRLTINFRFKEGSAKLDNKAQEDLKRLINYLHTNQNLEVILVGFGDPKRSAERSQLLSKLRAMAVRRELVRHGIYPEKTVGFGESFPVASANHLEGRIKNRRVEVWVRPK